MGPAAARLHPPEPEATLDAFFDWYYRTNPVSATFIGIHRHDHRLPDYSPAAIEQALAAIETLSDGLRRQRPTAPGRATTLDQELALGFLDVLRWEYASGYFHARNPSLYTGEAVFGVLSLFLRPFAPPRERIEAAIGRMRRIPALLAQAQHNVGQAPRAWAERSIRECTGALAFFERGVAILIQDEGITHSGLQAAADQAAAAFRRFKAYLESDLLPRASAPYACGADAFDLLLRRGHFVAMDAGAVLAQAEEQVAACERQLEARAVDAGATSWREAVTRLAGRHPPPEAYYRRYRELWEAARQAAEAQALVTWPDAPIRFVPQPRWAREAAPSLYFLFYRAPAAFDHLPVVDYLVTPVEPDMPPDEQTRRLQTNNDTAIKLTHVIHHAGLGHHVQNWYANRASSRIGQIAAVDCASRIAVYCGGTMAEGWACYAVDLMEEVGFLDPLDRVAQAQSRLRMAARAVVDVKLHCGTWALEDAERFYQDRAGMTRDAAHAEAVKNSIFPGTALMYLVGTRGIHDLRRDLVGRSRDFTLQRFHDRLLSYGSVPVARISALMRAPDAPPAGSSPEKVRRRKRPRRGQLRKATPGQS